MDYTAKGRFQKLLRSSTFWILGFASTLLAVVWFATWWQIWSDRAAQQRDNMQEVANLAIVFEQNVTRTVGEIDRLLVHLRETQQVGAVSGWSELISNRHLADRQQIQIAVTNAKGIMVATSLGSLPAKPLDLSDREHVRTHISSRVDRLFISRPVLGRVSKKWVVQLSRPFFLPSGELGGVMIVSLDPSYLSRIYGAIAMGQGSGLALIGHDDVIRAGTGIFESQLGRGLRSALVEGTSLPPRSRTSLFLSEANGLVRIVASRDVVDYPLSVIIIGGDLNLDKGVLMNKHVYLLWASILSGVVVAASFVAIRNRYRHERQMARLVRHDSLTGLANRPWFRQVLARMITGASEANMIALHLIDLDKFKEVNDTYGHPIGDELLIAVAHRLSGTLRAGDLAARFGGDEFAVIQSGVRNVVDAEALAKRLCNALSEVYDINGLRLEISASIGVSLVPRDSANRKGILASADLALYAAKSDGRNCYRLYEEKLNAAAEERRLIAAELKLGIANEQLVLHYQPIYDVASERFTGYEALVRWQHPVRGLVSPGVFIPVAEESDLIVPLGNWALNTACAEMAARSNHLTVAVNFSPVQFRKSDVVAAVREALANSGLPASRLEVEITESTLMKKDARTIKVLQELRAMGVKIAMDDFGTGYSSLSYLQSYPVNTIKIDRSFVDALGKEKSALSIIRAIIALANSLEMSTTAEGVETRAQLMQLQALGCRRLQGFYFSRPGTADEVLPHAAQPAPQTQPAASPTLEQV